MPQHKSWELDWGPTVPTMNSQAARFEVSDSLEFTLW